jgi:DNA-binding MarR family transcriptional regulator
MTADFIEAFRRDFRRLERVAGFRFKDEASCCGVTIAQCHAILEIGSEELLNVKDLATRLGLDKSTLSRTVENLVAEGLAERNVGKDDRRSVEIRLTSKGRKALDRINKTTDNYYEAIFRRISPDKHIQIVEAISLLANAFNETSDIVSGTTCCEIEEK